MILTADRYEQIISTLRSDDPSVRGSEKRLSPRVGLRMQIVLLPKSQGPRTIANRLTVWLRNLSAAGIGFIHPKPIAKGSRLIACLPRDREDFLTILYQVIHCTRVVDGQYHIGARLEQILDESVTG